MRIRDTTNERLVRLLVDSVSEVSRLTVLSQPVPKKLQANADRAGRELSKRMAATEGHVNRWWPLFDGEGQ